MAAPRELKINARGLSSPGARMMVQTALEKQSYAVVRVVVSNADAAAHIREYLADEGRSVTVDEVGEEFHIQATTHE